MKTTRVNKKRNGVYIGSDTLLETIIKKLIVEVIMNKTLCMQKSGKIDKTIT